MRPEQIKRLQALEELLADEFIDEADPTHWPGFGLRSAQLDPGQRKERYIYKRAACETAALLTRTQTMLVYPRYAGDDPRNDSDAEHLISIAERRATEAVERAMERAKSR
jgi:hypothetical protein